MFAETGDDRSRFADTKSLKAYAGSAPTTRTSGKSVAVLARRVNHQRLAAVGYVWAFAAMAHSNGARAHYDRRRETGDRHTAAQRNLLPSFCRNSLRSTPVRWSNTPSFCHLAK
ncbi:transposase [Streptomyces sparsogenes]